MEPTKSQGKRSLISFKIEEEDEDTRRPNNSVVLMHHGEDDNERRTKRVMVVNNSTNNASGPRKRAEAGESMSSMRLSCQVQSCNADLIDAKQYYRRHKVCDFHSKAPEVLIGGLQQRFCQQCSRFHDLSEFDESKRSCRRRLAGHNERRRKTSSD